MKAIYKAALATSLALSASTAKAADQRSSIYFNANNPACASVDTNIKNNGKPCPLPNSGEYSIDVNINELFSAGNTACASITAKDDGRPCYFPSSVMNKKLNAGD